MALLASCGEKYRSPSEAMEETIKVGEVFSIKKTSVFNRNDIVVFKILADNFQTYNEETRHYKKEWQKWLKRLIAVSGDSIQIENADIIVNGKDIPDPPKSLSEYDLWPSGNNRAGWPVRRAPDRGK